MAIIETPGKLFQSDRLVRCIAVNCSGNVTGEFAKEIKEKYPEAVNAYTDFCRVLGEKAMAEVQFVPCHDGTIIANMFVQEVGIGNRAMVDPLAVEECMERLCTFAAKTQLPIGVPENLGVNPKYANWEAVKPVIEPYLGTAPCDFQLITPPVKALRKSKASETSGETSGKNEGVPTGSNGGEGEPLNGTLTELPAGTPGEETAAPPAEPPAETLGEAPAVPPVEPPAEAPAEKPAETPAAPPVENNPPAAEKPETPQKRPPVTIRVETAGQEWTATLISKGGKTKSIPGTAECSSAALTGTIHALCALKVACDVTLYTDDEELAQAVSQGVDKKGYSWERLDGLMQFHNITIGQVPAEKAS